MKRPLAALGCSLLLGACADSAPPGQTDASSAAAGRQAPREAFFVVLTGPAAVKAIPHGVDVRSPAAGAATKKRVLEIGAEQAALEPLLIAEGAEVIAHLTRLANAMQVMTDETTARRIAGLPGVLRVEKVPLVERSLLSAVPAIGAPAVWAQIPGIKGAGITIGIIDSGIDYTHADFAGVGTVDAYTTNDPDVIEPGTFPTTKVIGGIDFVGDAYNPSANIGPNPDPDPLDCVTAVGEQISGGHGTHVAGIAAGTGVTAAGASFAGPYEASIDPSDFLVGPGVAPEASLFALKVFGCQGSTTMLTSALDRAADPNNDGSFDDRLDVVNGSLGSSFGLGSQVTGDMITELTGVGTLVVAAAGNDGQNFFATGSPASFPEVLSVAASVDNRLVNLRVTAPAAASYPAAEGMFTASLVSTGALSAPLVLADPVLGCEPFNNAAAMPGAIALIDRGSCAFVDKFANAVAAGAIGAVLIDNDVANLPFAMSGTPGTSPIPGVMVTQAHGALLKTALSNGPVTIGLDPTDIYTGPGAELLAGFSSRGPSAIDGRLKPEISAPGSAIDSAGVGSGNQPRTNQGTSMACPMVTGAAALLRQAKPSLSPLEVKAALMNGSASLADFAGTKYTSTVVGAGRVDIERSVNSTLLAAFNRDSGEVGISFGSTIAATPQTVVRDFQVQNQGATTETVALTIEPTFELPGVVVSVEPAELVLAAGASEAAQLTLEFDPTLLGDAGPDPGTAATQGQQSPQARHYLNQATGRIRMQSASSDIVLPYTGSVRAASTEHGVPPSECGPAPAEGEPIVITREGGGAHPAPVITAFQLSALDDADERSPTDPEIAMTDLRAVGVATDLKTAEPFGSAFVYFGIAVEGPWTTPARGPLSVVKIRINTDQSGGDEYEVRVEARNPDGPFRDALVASPYNLDTGERGERFPVNDVLADEAHSYPFTSTVLVVPVNLNDIGIEEDAVAFEWDVRAERPDLLVGGSDELHGTFDINELWIDTAINGLDGKPIFIGDEPIKVALTPGAQSSGAPLDVLLLEHTNQPGQQWEVVSLAPQAVGNLSIAATAPASIAESETAEVVLTITNGDRPGPGVTVTGTTVGGELVSATTTAGSCTPGASLSCSLGDLAAGATAEIRATVRGAAGATVSLQASISSTLACETSSDDNSATASLTVGGTTTPPGTTTEAGRVTPSGGCACDMSPSAPRSTGLAWLAAVGLVLSRRTRARRPEARR
ncbi:MAG: S8 family serine peptidase [Polyangiaceae bacterium]|nr:S8 family serine peptidase [Polyangiaceae bacterium]